MRKWTKDQLAAIESRDCNLLVSAAAGSGKTALLIERIKCLILDENVDVCEILVMTFTRAAASEMKERLRQALTDALTMPQTEPYRIADQLYRLNRASISTLDAFCTHFLREHFQAAGVAPDFKLGNEAELKMLRREALEEVLEDHYAQIPENELDAFGRLAEMLSSNRSDEPLIQLVIDFYTFLETLPDPDRWCEEALRYFDFPDPDFFRSFWGKAMRSYAMEQVCSAEKLLNEALETAGDISVFQKTKGILESELKQAEALREVLGKKTAQDFISALRQLSFQRYYGGRPKEDDEKAIGSRIKNLRQTAKEMLTTLQKDYILDASDMMAAITEMKEPVAVLIDLTRDFKSAYFEKKKGRSLLDFSDTERLTLQILKENDVLRQAMRRKYSYVFMDEYQDTNGIQEAILQCIVRDDNYFMVGDVKQSIYRFRLADPGIFIEKLHHFLPEDGNHSQEFIKDRLIALSQNFRSSASVIDSVNCVFEKVMTEKVGEVAYDDRAKLYKGLPESGPAYPTEIHLLSKNQKNSDSESGDDESAGLTAIEQEAVYIAGKIQEMIGKPLFRTRKGLAEPLRYSDIGILMRGVAGKGTVFRRIFKDAGIPLYFDGGEIYYNTTEVTLIMNLLKLIDNPLQDMPLLAYILSPAGGFTTDECAEIRSSASAFYFHQGFWQYPERHDEPNSSLKEKIECFREQLKRWRFELQTMDVQTFLWKIYRDTGYYTFVGGLPGGEQRQSNLRQLLAKAAAYKKSTMKGLFHFIRFVENLRQRKIDDVPPGVLDGQEDAVQLMTIHKSKGLEFPVVFIAGAATKFKTSDSSQLIRFHKDLGICPECIRREQNQRFPTVATYLCKERQRIEALSEEMRLLYVAMTRAEERLIFVGSLSDKMLISRQKKWQEKPDDYYCSHVSGSLDWVMMAVQNEPECFTVQTGEIPAMSGSDFIPTNISEKSASFMEEDTEKINARLSWQYPYRDEVALPEKMSVTAIAKKQTKGNEAQELPVCSPRPLFMQNLSGDIPHKETPRQWTGTELGTAVHAVLNDLNLDAIRASSDYFTAVSNHADQMVVKEKLSEDLRMALNLELISTFFESALGQRLLAAKTVWREQPFNYSIPAESISEEWQNRQEKVVLQGMIDCCFLEEGQWVLLDYKTDVYKGKDGIEALKEKYRMQLTIYAEALEVLTGKKVKEKILVLLNGNDVAEL